MLKKKRWLLAGIIALAAIALLVLVLLLVKNGRSKQINVYAVSDFSMDQYWGSESETYGAVYLDKIQTVYISDTQKISEVYVKEGQTVKAGDKLLAYDTTLTDIALQKAQITPGKIQGAAGICQAGAAEAQYPHAPQLRTGDAQ